MIKKCHLKSNEKIKMKALNRMRLCLVFVDFYFSIDFMSIFDLCVFVDFFFCFVFLMKCGMFIACKRMFACECRAFHKHAGDEHDFVIISKFHLFHCWHDHFIEKYLNFKPIVQSIRNSHKTWHNGIILNRPLSITYRQIEEFFFSIFKQKIKQWLPPGQQVLFLHEMINIGNKYNLIYELKMRRI